MNGPERAEARPSPHRLGRWFPLPLVGCSTILVALILVTPVLFTNGRPTAGTYATQAELVVDHVVGSRAVDLYIRPYDSLVRYASITIAIAGNFTWTGSYVANPGSWTWTNLSDVLEAHVRTFANPIEINITAVYTQNGVAEYGGHIALDFANASGGPVISFAIDPRTPNVVTPPSPWPVADLPSSIQLQNFGGSSPP